VAVPAVARADANDPSGPSPDQSTDAPAAPVSPAPAPEPRPDPQPAPTPHPEPAPRSDPPPDTEPQPAPTPEPQPEPGPTTPPTTDPEPGHAPSAGPTREPAHPAPAPEVQPPASEPTSTTTPPVDDIDEPTEAVGIDGITRPIAFPVLGPVRYSNDFGACRDGCARHHQGNDMIGVRMQPLLAAVDGTVTLLRYESVGISSVTIRITGDDGWYYNYFHVNNDTPGTDDGHATHEWQITPGLTVGSRVRAGQLVGYMGDSGNAEFSVPHLHFEIRTPDRTPVNPYYSLVAAQRAETCVGGTAAWTNTPLEALSPSAVAVIPLADGGRWVIDADGRLRADGAAAHIQPVAGLDCDVVPVAAASAPAAAPLAPVTAASAPVAAAAAPVATGSVPVAAPSALADGTPAMIAPAAAPAAPAPVLPAPAPATAADRWTVEPGDSLWHIVQTHYGTSDTAATISLVDLVFDANRDQLTDPNLLRVGMELALPPVPA